MLGHRGSPLKLGDCNSQSRFLLLLMRVKIEGKVDISCYNCMIVEEKRRWILKEEKSLVDNICGASIFRLGSHYRECRGVELSNRWKDR